MQAAYLETHIFSNDDVIQSTSPSDKEIDTTNPYVVVAEHANQGLEAYHIAQAQLGLEEQGWALLRGFKHDLNVFNELVSAFCHKLTFDPAREFSSHISQKVDAGTLPVGLHIENGNTPFPPELVAFYSQKSALTGSQTTLCDGVSLYNALPEPLQKRFSTPITVTRTLPEHLWKAYIRNEHPRLASDQEVTIQHLNDVINAVPGQTARLNNKGELDYTLTIDPLLKKKGNTAFANAILGPSFNYQTPIYRHANGDKVTEEELTQIAMYAEQYTFELTWQDGDMILIDNTRVMHGRRAIEGNPNQRQLVIAMGRNA